MIDKSNVSNCRVSSVLNKDAKNFGRQFILDQREDTCWSSEEGKSQWIRVDFKTAVSFNCLKIQFQGGFAGRECCIEIADTSPDAESILESFYPEDNNALQSFPLSKTYSSKSVTVHFRSSTDFFGRIIVYSLDLCS